MKQVLLAHPVIAEIIAVVGGEDNHGGVEQAARFQKPHQDADLVVDLRDQPHIGRNDLLARLVARHVARVVHVHIGGEHRMRLLAFLLRADRRFDIARAIHAGIGFRRDIGPVRLDIGQVQAPWSPVSFRLRDEIHRAARHIRCLGILLGDAGGLVGVNQKPAVLQAAIVRGAGIGPLLPGIVRLISAFAQVSVIARAGPAAWVQAVIALIGLEPAFRDMHADDRVRGNAEHLESFEVGRHMSSCRPARCARRFSSGDRRGWVRRHATASRSSASHASACSALYRTTSATGRRSAIAHRRSKNAPPVVPARRCSVFSAPGVPCIPDNHGEADRT